MSDQNTLVNLNTAGREELMTLTGVGPAIADRILENRPYASIEDLQRVAGIGSSFVAGIRAMVTVNNDGSPARMPDEALTAEVAPAGPQEPTTEFSSPEPAVEAETETPFEVHTQETGAETEMKEDLPEEAPPPGVFENIEAQPEPPSAEEVSEQAPESDGAVKVFAIPEGQTPGPQAEFASPPVQPAAGAAQPKAVTRAQALWMAAGTGFLALVLALLLSLGILAAINGGLRFVSPADLNALGRKVDGVTTQTQLLQQDLDGLRTRVNNLEGLSGRVSSVEGQAKQLRTDLDAASQQVSQINQQMTQVSSDIKDLQTQTGHFQGFLDGLKSLLNQIAQP
jgi:competence ComEA-like helix-hairpin-helix protein